MDASILERIQIMSTQLLPFLFAVVVHEVGHGLMALYWGDTTARDHGRLTLNPVPHIDPIGTLLFPMINMLTGIPILIGWAKPVPIQPTRFRKYRPGLFWVSLAGPGMNFICGFFAALLFLCLMLFVPQTFYFYEPFLLIARTAVSINFALGVFNLLPLPPLDGGRVIESFLNYRQQQVYDRITPYSFWILMLLMMTGALSLLHGPIQFLMQGSIQIWVMLFSFLGVAI